MSKCRRDPLSASWANLGVLAVVTALVLGAGSGMAYADGGGATIRSLPESSELQANITVEHSCPGYAYKPTESCNWFGEAAAYGAVGCPVVFDLSHSIWVGPDQTYPGKSSGSVAFSTFGLSRFVVICLYVHSELDELVGQSHPFDRTTGREVLPAPNLPGQPVPGSACGKERARGVTYRLVVSRGVSCGVARRKMQSFLAGSKSRRTLPGGWRCKRQSMDGEAGALCVRHGVTIQAYAA